MVTVQVPVPEQPAPLQPTKKDPLFAVAVSVTAVSLAKPDEQIEPQLIPLGELVTVPEPAPDLTTVKVYEVGLIAKVAVTDLAASMVTEQEPEPEHAPPQLEKVEPIEATAVRVMEVLELKLWEQVEPQLMPLGELVTVPEPVPVLVMVRVYWGGLIVKVAVTDLAASMVTEHEPEPEHAPPQLEKVEPVEATAFKVREVPELKL